MTHTLHALLSCVVTILLQLEYVRMEESTLETLFCRYMIIKAPKSHTVMTLNLVEEMVWALRLPTQNQVLLFVVHTYYESTAMKVRSVPGQVQSRS